jgi:GH24 family phage-related lysozyme (muramidase)
MAVPPSAIKKLKTNTRDYTQTAVIVLIKYGVFRAQDVDDAIAAVNSKNTWIAPSNLPDYDDSIENDIIIGKQNPTITKIRNIIAAHYGINLEEELVEETQELIEDTSEQEENKKSPAGALVVSNISKKQVSEDDLVEEEIDERILRILGLEDVFDIDYETYISLLKEKLISSRMTDSKLSAEEDELIREEFKRVKGKVGRFKPKRKTKIDVSNLTGISLLKPADKKQSGEESSEEEQKRTSIFDGILNILESITGTVDNIYGAISLNNSLLNNQLEFDRRESERLRRGGEEERLETKKDGFLAKAKKILAPFESIFDRILKFLVFTILGRAFKLFMDWASDPENRKKLETIGKFLKDWWPALLGAWFLFANPLGRFIRTIVGTVAKLTFKLAKFAIPKLLSFIKANPKAIAVAAAIGGGAYLATKVTGQKEAAPIQAENKAKAQRGEALDIRGTDTPIDKSPSVGDMGPSTPFGLLQGVQGANTGGIIGPLIRGVSNVNEKINVKNKTHNTYSTGGSISNLGNISNSNRTHNTYSTGGSISNLSNLSNLSNSNRTHNTYSTGGSISNLSNLSNLSNSNRTHNTYSTGGSISNLSNLSNLSNSNRTHNTYSTGGSISNLSNLSNLSNSNRTHNTYSTGGSISNLSNLSNLSNSNRTHNTYSTGGNIFSGVVNKDTGETVSGAGPDTQFLPIEDGGGAVLQRGESVLQVGARERMIKQAGVDPLAFNIGSNANKPRKINADTLASSYGGFIGLSNGGEIGTATHHLKQDEALSSLTSGINDFAKPGSSNWSKVNANTILHSYLDSENVPTIGWGSTFYDNILNGKRPVRMGDKISKTQADNILNTNVSNLSKEYSTKIPHWGKMSNNQRAGLLILGYNAPNGPTGVYKNLTKSLQQGDMRAAAQHVQRGGPNPERIALERKLLLSGPPIVKNLVGEKKVGPEIVGSGIPGIPPFLYNMQQRMQKKQGGGVVKEGDGSYNPHSPADRRMFPIVNTPNLMGIASLQPGEGIITKRAMQSGAEPLVQTINALLDPNSEAAKSGTRTALIDKTKPKVTDIGPPIRGRGGIAPITLPPISQSSGNVPTSSTSGTQVPPFATVSSAAMSVRINNADTYGITG